MEPIFKKSCIIRARGLCRRQFAFFLLATGSESEDLPYYAAILLSWQKILKALCDLISDIIVLGSEGARC
jgi:hypothetical protein